MAVVESIPEKNQSPSAQKGVLDYCMQPSKTLDEDEQLAYISGYNCVPELASESFLTTQKVFGHEPDGVRFYHFVQSFKIGETISPQEANDIGMELVQSFEKFKIMKPLSPRISTKTTYTIILSYALMTLKMVAKFIITSIFSVISAREATKYAKFTG